VPLPAVRAPPCPLRASNAAAERQSRDGALERIDEGSYRPSIEGRRRGSNRATAGMGVVTVPCMGIARMRMSGGRTRFCSARPYALVLLRGGYRVSRIAGMAAVRASAHAGRVCASAHAAYACAGCERICRRRRYGRRQLFAYLLPPPRLLPPGRPRRDAVIMSLACPPRLPLQLLTAAWRGSCNVTAARARVGA
jgi:hypothetical protein